VPPPEPEPEPEPEPRRLTTVQRIRRIEAIIESVRPMLQRDHGDVELVDVDGQEIYVHMKGACAGCQLAGATLGGVQQALMEGLGERVRVLPASSAMIASMMMEEA
jgi:NifU-like protein